MHRGAAVKNQAQPLRVTSIARQRPRGRAPSRRPARTIQRWILRRAAEASTLARFTASPKSQAAEDRDRRNRAERQRAATEMQAAAANAYRPPGRGGRPGDFTILCKEEEFLEPSRHVSTTRSTIVPC